MNKYKISDPHRYQQSGVVMFYYINKSKINRQGSCPLLLRLTLNQVQTCISLKYSIKPEHWNKEVQRVTPDNENFVEINNFLDVVKSNLYKMYNDLARENGEVTMQALKEKFTGSDKNAPKLMIAEFNEINQQYVEMKNLNPSKKSGSQKRLTVVKYLKEFIFITIKGKDIPFKAVDYKFICDFEHYLKSVKRCNQNTSSKYLQIFKSVVNYAINNGWITTNPFANKKLTKVKVDRGYLTQDEINAVRSLDFEQFWRLERVRDIFIFSCYCGLSYIDVTNLCLRDLERDADGQWWIRQNRQKSQVKSHIPLLPVAENILLKYGSFTNDNADVKMLPGLSNQKMNAYLKEIATLAKLSKNLTFHLARHTFATTIGLSNGVPIETISKMLGHTNIKTTQIYARIVDEKIKADFLILKGKLEDLDSN